MADRYQYQDTRQWVRLPVDWYIKYTVAGQGGPETLAVARDASAGGLRVATKERIAVGTSLSLKINAPVLGRTLTAIGRVIRVRETAPQLFEWGIEFEQINDQDRAEFNDRIEALSHQWRARQRRAWWRRI